MIVFDLMCAGGHRFESWFHNAAAFDRQQAGADIECPFCGSRAITKAPMAAHVANALVRGNARDQARENAGGGNADEPAPGGGGVSGGSPGAGAPGAGPPALLMEALQRVRRHVEANCDYVGPAFAEEARRIYYRETTPRSIYGEARPAEAEALNEEGIEVQNIPWLPRRND